MAAPGDGGDIIVKGGSVEMEFDDGLYPKEPHDPKRRKNANRKITRIRVEDEGGAERYNSGEDQSGLKWKVIVSTR